MRQSTSLQNNEIILWCALDPFTGTIVEYPNYIAAKIETYYKNFINNGYTGNVPDALLLGKNYYNAIINYSANIGFFQKYGLNYKKKEDDNYFNVKRIILNDSYGNSLYYSLYITNVYNRWRISEVRTFYNMQLFIYDNKILIELYANKDNTITASNINDYLTTEIKIWEPTDINNSDINKYVVVWQWCNATKESHGNELYNLSDSHYTPYLYEQNKIIEEGYNNNLTEIEIILPVINITKHIKVNKKKYYGLQIDKLNKTRRHVRRSVMKLSELQEKLNKTQIIRNQAYYDNINPNEIPNEFICPIGLQIMTEPVSTCDGFTYDNKNITRWLQNSERSPLTGLVLNNTRLSINKVLQDKINKYVNDNLMR